MTPATTAPSTHCPVRIPEAAIWQATRDAEQAVSMAAEGPENPKAYEMRPGATAEDPAVKENGPIWESQSKS